MTDQATIDQRMHDLQRDIKSKSFNIGIGMFFVAIIVATIVYILYLIFSSIYRWWKTIKRNEAAMNMSLSQGSNPLLDASFDDVERIDMEDNSSDNDYNKIKQTIRNTFTAYQTYNQSLKDFYLNALKKNAPDKIDSSSLLAENDNW